MRKSLNLSNPTMVSCSQPNLKDPSSASNFSHVTVQHIHLQWIIDFVQKIIEGKCSLDVEALQDANEVVLDALDLDITAIRCDGSELKYTSGQFHELGQKLSIELPLQKGDKKKVEIEYSTSKNGASAIQFMDKEMTVDKTHPFLYSQSQAIHARSIMPCMDTPSVKQTYSAEVTVPKEFVCLMSALDKGSEKNNDSSIFRFDQPVVIPTYLIAIVVGSLEKRDLSNRCCVWAEPSVVEKAQWEFEDTEKMLQAAENLMGKYEWGRYDLVVLPNTFPFGGMENVCMTFVTPTLLAGDRSMTHVISHEIAHSWTGNLTTNANWEHFWLNEGFTVFVERKILKELYGKEVREFDSLTGFDDELVPCINKEFSPVHEFTKLIPSLPGIDPDEAFCKVPYEKGSAFLLYLEQQLGDEKRFEQMLRDYIKKYRQQSVTTEMWIDFLKASFADKKDILDKVDFDGWLNKPGLPPNKPHYNYSLIEKCVQLANKWSQLPINELTEENVGAYFKLSTNQKINFLNLVCNGQPLEQERVALLEKLYGLDKTQNAELLAAFILIAIKAAWLPVIPIALQFVKVNGRMKYLKPVYTALFEWNESSKQAAETFNKERPFMHPISAKVVENLLKKYLN